MRAHERQDKENCNSTEEGLSPHTGDQHILDQNSILLARRSRMQWGESRCGTCCSSPGRCGADKTRCWTTYDVDNNGNQLGRRRAILFRQKDLNKLPLLRAVLSSSVETREAFAIHRVRWACEQFRAAGIRSRRWQLFKSTGIH